MGDSIEEYRLRSLLHDVWENSSDESSSTEVSDHCSEHNLESDTEQEPNIESSSDPDSDDSAPLSSLRTNLPSTSGQAPHYKSKDNQIWYKRHVQI